MTDAMEESVVGAALQAVRHAIDVSVGSTGPNHPLREAERLLARAEKASLDGGDRALRVALRDLAEQLHPYAVGDRLLSFQAVEGLERFVGRTDVLYRLTQRSSNKTPSRSRPLRTAPRVLRSASSGSVDEDLLTPLAPSTLGTEINADIYSEVLSVFAFEARDQLRLLKTALRRLQSEANDYASRAEVVKRLRSMKGSAALVGAEDVRVVAHAAEDLATAHLDGAALAPGDLTLLARVCSALESLSLGDAAERSVVDINELLGTLSEQTESARRLEVVPRSPRVDPAGFSQAPVPDQGEVDRVSDVEPSAIAAQTSAEQDEAPAESEAPPEPPEEARLKEALASRTLAAIANPAWDQEQLTKLDELVRELDETRALVDRRRYRFDNPMAGLRSATGRLRELSERLRSSVDAEPGSDGETSLPANELRSAADELESVAAELTSSDMQLSFATSELEADLLQLRGSIQLLKQRVRLFRQAPLETLARGLHGAVRGAARERDKQVRLTLTGFDISVDEGLVEAIGECLLCLVQNAVQHGIESAQLRHLRGKPKVGDVQVKAHRVGPRLLIEVTDDGAGLDEKAVRLQAARRGMLPAAGALEPSQEAWDLARRANFSTVQDQQGNGLDLVEGALGRVAGSMRISSRPYKGTVVQLEVPIDLTLSRGLVVERRGSAVAIPSSSVLRVMRLKQDAFDTGAVQKTSDSVVFQDKRFTIVDLADLQASQAGDPAAAAASGAEELDVNATLLLIASDAGRRALLVDRVRDAGELAIYPPGPLLDRYPGVLGFALCEEEQLLPVLDPASIVAPEAAPVDEEPDEEDREPDTVVVVDDVASVRRVVGLLLERLGVRTVVAADGEAALQMIEDEASEPLMALIDVGMPRMNGFELTTALRERGYRFPVYLFTSPSANLPHTDELDVEGYVFKPLVRRELAALLRRHRKQKDRASSVQAREPAGVES